VRDDPADSWLAYTVARGNGTLLTKMNATWQVPAYPTTRDGGNAPGWWFGIEPNPASDLIQPILAYGYTGSEYSIFNGYYQWDNDYWWFSETHKVEPGMVIFGSVVYDQANSAYIMNISSLSDGWYVTNSIAIEEGKLYTDAYFVVEHQPNDCSEYPADGQIIFKNINIEWNGQLMRPTWDKETYQDACNCQPSVLDSQTIKFSWDTSTKNNVVEDN